MEQGRMRIKFNKTYKGEVYVLYLYIKVNTHIAEIRRAVYEENFKCVVSKDFKTLTIVGKGMELVARQDWKDKKIFTEFKIPHEEQKRIKEYITGEI